MDPDETLRRIRELTKELPYLHNGEAYELQELIQSLDEWLAKGGFLPKAWPGADVQ